MKGVPRPPVKYALVKPILIGKPTYGGIEPLTLRAVAMARASYGDAIINYSASQRFGFWPWRFLRPVVRGDAVRIDNPEVFDCRALGGKLYSGVADGAGGGETEYERGRREERERMERERTGAGAPN